MKTKVTKFYEDHKANFLIVAGIISSIMSVAIGGVVGISIGSVVGSFISVAGGIAIRKKTEYNSSTDMLLFHNFGESLGTVRDLPEGDSLTEVVRAKSYITDDTEIIGVKYYFRNN